MAAPRKSWVLASLAALALCPAWAAAAQDPLQDAAILHGQAFANAQGNISVNAVAGANNQQANMAVIATGDRAAGRASLVQLLGPGADDTGRLASAQIVGNAFANASGLIAVNVAAGADNQQGNLAVISLALGGEVVSDLVLSQSRASQQRPGGSVDAPGTGDTLLSPGAFENSSGIVQVSIIGGERNASSNLFALSVQDGAKP